MVQRKRKKNTRQRGSHTHGWGSKKKHRGSGNRGGAGHSGTGKRSDSNKPSVWGLKRFYGRFGFSPVRPKTIKTISIKNLEAKLDMFVSKKLATKQGDIYEVDLEKLGYNKLLGGGSLKKKIKFSGDLAAGAKTEIEKAGGQILEKA